MKKFLFDLFPVIIFFIAYKLGDANPEATRQILQQIGLPQPTGINEKPGIYLATFVAILASVAQILWVKLRGKKVETMLWVSMGIILVFGGATKASSNGSPRCCTGYLPGPFSVLRSLAVT